MELRDRDGLTEQEFLERYRPGDYARPSVACDMVIFTVMDRTRRPSISGMLGAARRFCPAG